MTPVFTLFFPVTFSFGVPPSLLLPLCAYGRFWQSYLRFLRCAPLVGAVDGTPFPWDPTSGMRACLMVPARFADLDLRTLFMLSGTVRMRLRPFDKPVLRILCSWQARLQRRPGLILRRLLSLGSVKINVDGAFIRSARLGAIGVLARDSSGAVLGGFARPVPVLGTASAVEAFALFAGLEFAIASRWASAMVESDAAVLINKLHRPTPDLSLLGDLPVPSRNLIAASRGCLWVGFAPRSANSAAHALASWACHNNDVLSFSSVCLELISRVVLDDLSSSF
ncbi:hypothetical protein GQ457_16G017890 [Hibiscus cannabinus]